MRQFLVLPLTLMLALAINVHAQAQKLNWVPLEKACFLMGEAKAYAEERPPHERCVSAFQITQTEITNAQFDEFVQETGYVTRAERGWAADEEGGPGMKMQGGSAVFSPPDGSSQRGLSWWKYVEGANWHAPNGPESEAAAPYAPVVHVTREDAQSFAKWAGGRLPTEAEWEYAARGGIEGQVLSWSAAESAALKEKANTWQGIFPIADTGEDGFQGIAPVASFSPNGFGLYDMVGNVWEWTDTPYTPSHSTRDREVTGANGLDRAQPGIAVGTIKGGSFLCASNYCFRFRPAARQAQDLAFGTSHIGFRVVKEMDAELG